MASSSAVSRSCGSGVGVEVVGGVMYGLEMVTGGERDAHSLICCSAIVLLIRAWVFQTI